MVTARGRPSGIAQTITEIAIMTVSKISNQSLFFKESSNVNFSQPGYSSRTNKFWHPHGRTSVISRASLTIREKKVNTAHKIPTFPILLAIVSNFLYKRVGSLSFIVFEVMIPATVFGPTATTRAFPNPDWTRDFANIELIAPCL